MKKVNMYTGFMLGAAMMASVSGTAMAALQVSQPQLTASVEVKKEKGTTKGETEKKAEQNDKKQKQETSIYGTIYKIEKERMEVKTAVVIWDKAAEEKGDSAETQKKTGADKAAGKVLKADFETDDMKWKMDGKAVEVKFHKDTKYLKQVSPVIEKKEQKDKKSTAADKQGKNMDKEKTKTETIKREDLKEGDVIYVKLKNDGSLVVDEVLVLSEAKWNNSETKKIKTNASEDSGSKKEKGAKEASESDKGKKTNE